MPSLFIITGSNGAGKSTVGADYLPPGIRGTQYIFDGDKLAMQKRNELRLTVKAFKEAKNIADEWVDKLFAQKVKEAIKANAHFAYEGHFRNPSTLSTPRKFKRKKYWLSLIFMGLSNTEQSELRVLGRAKYGGHTVPFYEIEANFYGNLAMLNENYKLFNEVTVVDTSGIKPQRLLHLRNKELLSYMEIKLLPNWFIIYLPDLYKIIKRNASR